MSIVERKISMTKSDLVLLATLFLVCLLTFLPTLGITKIIDPSDGFYSESAREMWECKNFITPTLNYESWNDKPVLNDWLIVLSYSLWGVSEFASRLPAAICAIFICLLTFIAARQFMAQKVAFLAALILLSNFLFAILAHVSLTDMPLTLFVNMSLFSFFFGIQTGQSIFKYIAWAALALGFLTKGPISLLIVFGSFLIFLLLSTSKFGPRTIIHFFSNIGLIRGGALFAAIALPWFITVGIATKGQFLFDFFIVQNFQRATGALVLNHAQPFWFYIPVVAMSLFPYSSFAPFMLPVIAKWWRQRLQSSTRVDFILFCLSVCFTVFCGFSILKGKLPTYVLPMMPSASIVFAAGIFTLWRMGKNTLVLSGSSVAVVASIAGIIIFPKSIQATGTAGYFAQASMVVYALLFCILIACRILRKKVFQIYHLAAMCALLTAVLVPFILFEFYEHHQQDYNQILSLGLAQKGTLSQIWDTSPSAPFYAHRQIPRIHSFFDYAATLAYPGEHLVIGKNVYDRFIDYAPQKHLIARRGVWSLYSVSDPHQKLLQDYYSLLHQGSIKH